MPIQVIQLCAGVATQTVANQTAVDMAAAAQLKAGPAFPNVGKGNAVLVWDIAPGATPGVYVIQAEESDDNTTFTAIPGAQITDTSVGSTVYQNVTVSKRYVRIAVTDATAAAGTVDARLLSA